MHLPDVKTRMPCCGKGVVISCEETGAATGESHPWIGPCPCCGRVLVWALTHRAGRIALEVSVP